jgi:methyl-accepting chemotaxis protein
MEWFLRRLSLLQQMSFMVGVVIFGLFTCITIAVGIIGKVKVTGPFYHEIAQGKDLVADILPPPEYIIESYLVVQQALNEPDAKRRSNLYERLQKLQGEYEERHIYWDKELRDDDERQIILESSYKPAESFYQTAKDHYFPAIDHGDMKKARELLNGPLAEQYEIHRKEIDKAAILLDKKNTAREYRTVALLKSSNMLMAGVFFSVIALSGLVVFIIMRNIARSLSYCAGISDRIASGDLSVDVVVSGKGSIRKVLLSLDNMVGHLRDIITQTADVSARISSASNQLHSISAQIATGAEEVAAQARTVATASEEMAATSGDIAQNCTIAADASRHSTEAAITGSNVIQETITGMNLITDRVSQTATAIGALGARSEEIGDIIGTIEEIADQTNLLALNAAIEAARAGEQGRGFAVVADEVRALAERTTRATCEIGEMIKAIQSETRSAVKSMEEGVHEVEKGASSSLKSGNALEEIIRRIGEVSMQVNQIATAAEQQTATTSEVTSNIQMITDVVNQTAIRAEETAAAAAQMAGDAQELQKVVGLFQLK